MWKNALGFKTEQVLGIKNRGKSIKTVFPISYVSQYPEKWTQVVSWDNLHEETILSKVCNFKIRVPLKVLCWSLQFTSINSTWTDLFNWKKKIFYYIEMEITYQTVILSYMCPVAVYDSGTISKKTAAVKSFLVSVAIWNWNPIYEIPLKSNPICTMYFLICLIFILIQILKFV